MFRSPSIFLMIFALCIFPPPLSSASPPPSKYDTLLDEPLLYDGIITALNESAYRHYALKSPRPYQIILLFASPNLHRCPQCESVYSPFKELASAYSTSPPPPTPSDPVVFATLDPFTSPQIVSLHDLTLLPCVVHITSKSFTRRGSKVYYKQEYLLDARSIYSGGYHPSMVLSKLLPWVNMRTGRSVQLTPSPTTLLKNILLLLSVILCGLFTAYKFGKLFIKHKILLQLGSLFIFFVATSGFFFSLQREVSWTEVDRSTGKSVLVKREHRSQTMGEGVTMAAANLLGGAALAAVAAVANWKPKKTQIFKAMLLVVNAAAAVLLFLVLAKVFKYKNGWYAPNFWPPTDFRIGPVRVDRGNEF